MNAWTELGAIIAHPSASFRRGAIRGWHRRWFSALESTMVLDPLVLTQAPEAPEHAVRLVRQRIGNEVAKIVPVSTSDVLVAGAKCQEIRARLAVFLPEPR